MITLAPNVRQQELFSTIANMIVVRNHLKVLSGNTQMKGDEYKRVNEKIKLLDKSIMTLSLLTQPPYSIEEDISHD